MLQNIISHQKSTILLFICFCLSSISYSQEAKRTSPKWWFGLSGAVNKNYYEGNTQVLNNDLTVPAVFHKGESFKPYASILTEYRPSKLLGLMLNVGFDNRGGGFNQVIAPCNCPANLSTNLSYVTIEPSLKYTPFKSLFYVFAGPTFGININKEFQYSQLNQPLTTNNWSQIKENTVSAQFGLGFDFPVSAKASETQMTLSPFASFQTNLFDAPRTIESWSIYTVRAGVAIKLGYARKKPLPGKTKIILVPLSPIENDIQFSVRAPKFVPLNRQVKETFPLRNSIFFEKGSVNISSRYALLNSLDAKIFKEEQLQKSQPQNLSNGRSGRQLNIYHNILNILGDRMRSNIQSNVILYGSSDNNPAEGKIMAEHVKDYLVYNFKIDPSRITTEGRNKPFIPSEQPGAVNELDLLHEGDRRVDIESNSSELLMQVGGANAPYLRPVEIIAIQEDPLDSHVIFTNEGAIDHLDSWSIDVSDEQGMTQHYGPFSGNQFTIPGNSILGNNTQGNYTIVMTGITKSGQVVNKTSSVSLMKMEDPVQSGLRYSILFDFDKSKSISSYENFLKNVVAPLIKDSATVIIHGHTDIIGEEKYNLNLSRERAGGVQSILKQALEEVKIYNVKFETYGFGENISMTPFENKTPEERFYNRTVIIDIIPIKSK
jgi:outer membrane protein OmpA-like peptidoglycan-associated protein